jgi:glycosyltransferase involved in cell wall biosynthesis
MAQYDLVLTYDYGTLNLAMAHTAFSQAFGLPPLVHNEFGYGQSGKSELTPRRTWYRRIALGRTAALVVPSERLEGLALTVWQQPIGRVRHISPGVSVAEKAKKIAPDALRGLVKRDGEQWIGNLGGAGRSSDWKVALSALHQLPENWQFVIAGEGVHLSAIRNQAEKMELSHRVHLPGEVNDPTIFLGLLDIYIDLGAREAFPINSLMAMGAGLPIAGISSGDLSSIVGKEGSEFIVDIKQGNGLSHMLVSLAQDALSRRRIGEHNRSRAKGAYAEASMIEKFRRLCANLLGREL